jgi:hypothetical protein
VGWITPTRNWNKGKKSEFEDRKAFDVSVSMRHKTDV